MMEQPKEIKSTSLSLSQEQGMDGDGISWYPGVIPKGIRTEREVESSETSGNLQSKKAMKYSPLGMSEQGKYVLLSLPFIEFCYNISLFKYFTIESAGRNYFMNLNVCLSVRLSFCNCMQFTFIDNILIVLLLRKRMFDT